MRNKQEFLSALRDKLSGLPKEDLERSVDYYSEIIDDSMEDGLSEEEAIAAIGSMEDIVSQILMETSLPKLVKARVKPKRDWKAWEIVLLVLGSPVWLPLLSAAGVIILAVYIVIWSMVVVFYAVDLSFAAGAISSLFAAVMYLCSGGSAQGILFVGAGIFCAGITILLFFGFNRITKAILTFSKKILLRIKTRFIRKGETQ